MIESDREGGGGLTRASGTACCSFPYDTGECVSVSDVLDCILLPFQLDTDDLSYERLFVIASDHVEDAIQCAVELTVEVGSCQAIERPVYCDRKRARQGEETSRRRKGAMRERCSRRCVDMFFLGDQEYSQVAAGVERRPVRSARWQQ